MGSVADPLIRKLGRQGRVELGRHLVKASFSDSNLSSFSRYFDFYESEMTALQFGRSWPDPDLAASTHADLICIVQQLRQHRGSTRPQIRSVLVSSFPRSQPPSLNRAIDLAIRVWLTVNVRELALEHQNLRKTRMLQWDDYSTFQDFLHGLFPLSHWNLKAKASRLHPQFTAAYMVRVCGLKLAWTDSLEDHLRLDRYKDQNQLRVYRHKYLLQGQIDGAGGSHGSPRMVGHSDALLKETIKSLNLLFPRNDPRTRALLRHHREDFQVTGPFEGPRTLNLLEFTYWRDRILELHEEIYLSPPASWAQLWRDRRNPQQFWTFWIALVILFLTFVSTAVSIAQVMAAFKAL